MKTQFIAEIGSNHNGSLDRAEDLMREANRAGCWGVKFQYFRAEKLYAPEYPDHIRMMKPRELPDEWLPQIAQFCKQAALKFGCTPFHEEAVEILNPHVDYFKVSSFDILREGLIRKCLATGRPLMVSLGLARGRDIIRVGEIAKQENSSHRLTLMHCVSEYPSRLKDCQMAEGIGKVFRLMGSGQLDPDVGIGWSDHTTEPAAIYAALKHEVAFVECHVDLNDEQGWESTHGHCWTMQKLGKMIQVVRKIEKANGDSAWNQGESSTLMVWRADPEDGLRPLKEHRKE